MVSATESRSWYQNRENAYRRLRESVQARAERQAHVELNDARTEAFTGGRVFTWCAWRDRVQGPGGATSMSSALRGRLGALLG